jgi:predicted permease
MDSIWRDVRYAGRSLVKAPAFTAAVLVTLALGVGATTAVFSVVNGVLIKPLPYPKSESLVSVWHAAPGVDRPELRFSPTMFFTYRDENRTLQDLGLWSAGAATVTGLAEPERVQVIRVTFGTLQALAVQPTLGRWFSQEDDTPGTPETAILSYGYWRRRFPDDPSVIGRRIVVDGRPRDVVGVMPERFRFLDMNPEPDLILPQRFDRGQVSLGDFSYQGIARLKPGVTLMEANADVARMVPIWLGAWPAPRGMSTQVFASLRVTPTLHPLNRDVIGSIASVLWLLMGTVGIVLLITCANISNLLLVRTAERQQEFSVRMALGAGWTRIARGLFIEHATLALAGAILGIGVAFGALRLLVAMAPASLPRLADINIDGTVLSFAVAVSLASAVLFGALPILKHASSSFAMTIRSGRTASDSREQHRSRNILVVTQVTLAVVLLVASGLMIRTFQALRAVQPGFTQPEQLQLARLAIPEPLVRDPERVLRMQQEMRDRIAAIPGVAAVSFTTSAPMEPLNSGTDVVLVEDRKNADGEVPPAHRQKFVAPGLFETVGSRVIAGRDVTWSDIYSYRSVALISENLARQLWRDPTTALGKRIRENPDSPWREIIGVVGDVYDDGVNAPAPTIVYWPVMMKDFRRNPIQAQRVVTFVVRSTQSGTESFLGQVRQAVWAVNPTLPVAQVRTLQDVYARSLARTSFALVMLAISGALALLLGCVGIYGVVSYAVSRRTREIGIRMALGEQPAAVQRRFVRDGVVLAAIGSACGLLVAAGLTRVMDSVLFGVRPIDPTTYAGVCVVLIAAMTLASYVPARRAATVAPLEALRTE